MTEWKYKQNGLLYDWCQKVYGLIYTNKRKSTSRTKTNLRGESEMGYTCAVFKFNITFFHSIYRYMFNKDKNSTLYNITTLLQPDTHIQFHFRLF